MGCYADRNMTFESENMMKNILPIALGLFVSLTALNANAGQVCDKYFKEMNALVQQAEEQYKNEPNANEQIALMKSQLEDARKTLASYPEDTQEQACSQALTAIEHAKETVNKS
jgi:hypothetical protein